jgi:hypothetical protein
MDINVLNTNIASNLREKINQTGSVAGYIVKGHKDMNGQYICITWHFLSFDTNVACVFIMSDIKTIYQTIWWHNAVGIIFNGEI